MASINEIQALVEQIKADLPLLINRSQIAPKQIVTITGLSDISERLGLVQAGEFRSGNGQEPGYGFSGVRIGYPAFAYGNDTWNIVGVDNDELEVGIRASDGRLIAGGGDVEIGSFGIVIANASPSFVLRDSMGNADTIYLNATIDDYLEVRNNVPGGEVQLIVELTTDGQTRASWREDPVNVDAAQFALELASGGTKFTIGGSEVIIWAGRDGENTSFNTSHFDTDFVIYGTVTNQPPFRVDAADNRVEIGNDHYFPTRDASNPNGFWNEANQDMDFTFRSVNLDEMLKLDAGQDRATSFNWDGWAKRDETWTRTGDHQFTIAGDYTSIYRTGTKVRYGDGATDYGVVYTSVYSAPNTTVYLIPNSSYAMAATTITDTYISYVEAPVGFPNAFTFSPTWGSLSVGNGTVVSYWSITRNLLHLSIRLTFGTTTSFPGGIPTVSTPAAPSSGMYNYYAPIGNVTYLDAGVSLSLGLIIAGSSGTHELRVGLASGTYLTATTISATVPHAWGSGDVLSINARYFL